jgi:hypothetical protein
MAQILSKLVRMTIEGQVPPLLIALLFMVEFSKWAFRVSESKGRQLTT